MKCFSKGVIFSTLLINYEIVICTRNGQLATSCTYVCSYSQFWSLKCNFCNCTSSRIFIISPRKFKLCEIEDFAKITILYFWKWNTIYYCCYLHPSHFCQMVNICKAAVPMYTFGNDMIFMYNTSYDNFREKSLLFMIYDVYPP